MLPTSLSAATGGLDQAAGPNSGMGVAELPVSMRHDATARSVALLDGHDDLEVVGELDGKATSFW
jgi:hypothetical protein